jgi:hypothetical protein
VLEWLTKNPFEEVFVGGWKTGHEDGMLEQSKVSLEPERFS